ncbi:hypothetical protein FBZ94_10274 [Bradyrhizobium sacchari]|uniref:Uncharacterized protein n=1 Tax=Bradyrhizobium sacchari TaxID=1399419 RepID=A0A560J5M1_9BRAD|nr:hypothetical protein FBZ94_10274 [Bradyrhizobium sacchari]TWB80857.1 hypothetical protein FBZ95_10274 [Bradyrhizobium sacchari]
MQVAHPKQFGSIRLTTGALVDELGRKRTFMVGVRLFVASRPRINRIPLEKRQCGSLCSIRFYEVVLTTERRSRADQARLTVPVKWLHDCEQELLESWRSVTTFRLGEALGSKRVKHVTRSVPCNFRGEQ